jgi:hypothetical protein
MGAKNAQRVPVGSGREGRAPRLPRQYPYSIDSAAHQPLKLAAAADPASPFDSDWRFEFSAFSSRRSSANVTERPSAIRNATQRRSHFLTAFGRGKAFTAVTHYRQYRLVHNHYHMSSVSLESPRFPESGLRVRFAPR